MDVDDAIRKVLEGFDEGVFVRNIERDDDPTWALSMLEYIGALAILKRHTDSLSRVPTATDGG